MMRQAIKLAMLLIAALASSSCGNLLGTSTDDNIYLPSGPIPKGPVSIGRHYSFRFAEKWRIRHSWIQGTRIRPCGHGTNFFRKHPVPGHPELEYDENLALYDRGGRIYYVMDLQTTLQSGIFYFNLDNYVIGHVPDGFERDGYKPFCAQPLPDSPHGMALWILKPNPAFGTDKWIEDAVPTQVNGLTWLVRKVPPLDMGPGVKETRTIEYWTLPIPDTPYWLAMQFSANLRSLVEFPAEHVRMQNIFYELVRSVKLEPITPAPAPPFVEWAPPPRQAPPPQDTEPAIPLGARPIRR
ncbi:hypothetical protein LJR039_006958 [Pseudorhodoferax sp. LjRoot39]|uniref:hypothetical protein n=1 Tax=Pseudorhodoferax sp. LjRoot39 TaxID=3342328 RepID=UPI003ECD3534